MANVFTNVGEFRRGKGNRKTRLGPRINVESVSKRGGDRQVQTPDDIAIKRLFKLLDKPGLTQKDRYSYTDEMRNAEQIRFMNMQVLSEVLLFMHDVGNVVNAENFNYDAIESYINRLLPHKEISEGDTRPKEISADELQIMRLRLAATFLRYINYVLLLRGQAAQELEKAQARYEEIIPPIMDEF